MMNGRRRSCTSEREAAIMSPDPMPSPVDESRKRLLAGVAHGAERAVLEADHHAVHLAALDGPERRAALCAVADAGAPACGLHAHVALRAVLDARLLAGAEER